jgi:tetratricopeptide (TPR) repeat protein
MMDGGRCHNAFAFDILVSMAPEGSKQSRRSLKTILIVAIVAVSLAVIAAGYFLVVDHKKATKQAAVQQKAAQSQNHSRVMAQAKKLDYNSDFQGEVDALQKYLATKPSQQDANEAAMQLASAFINMGNYEQAIVYYKQVKETNDSRYSTDALKGLAVAYTMKKDNATAIDYYRQVIAAYKAQDSQYNTVFYDNVIKKLQAQP